MEAREEQCPIQFTVRARRVHLVMNSHKRMRYLRAVSEWKKRRLRRATREEITESRNIH